MLPDQSIKELVDIVGLTVKDAKTLVTLDGGERLDYYDEVLDHLGCSIDGVERLLIDNASNDEARSRSDVQLRKYAKAAANWCVTPSRIRFSANSFLPGFCMSSVAF